MMEHPLVKKIGKPVVCEPLEAYPLPELVVRGFMTFNATRFVLLEASDRNTFFVKIGDYLGHHFGKIAAVDDEGFVVREIMEDSDGMYYFAKTSISYDNKRTELSREYP
jgi:type IV pilus assembly protein PilP